MDACVYICVYTVYTSALNMCSLRILVHAHVRVFTNSVISFRDAMCVHLRTHLHLYLHNTGEDGKFNHINTMISLNTQANIRHDKHIKELLEEYQKQDVEGKDKSHRVSMRIYLYII